MPAYNHAVVVVNGLSFLIVNILGHQHIYSEVRSTAFIGESVFDCNPRDILLFSSIYATACN